MKLLKLLLDWSEVWALFFPLAILLIKPGQARFLRPLVAYCIIALVLNLCIDIIGSFRMKYHFPHWLQTNNYLYNVHSIVRFVCFSIFFNRIDPQRLKWRNWLSVLALLFIFINFIFFENFFTFKTFSSRLLTLEAAVLLFYCLQYYLSRLQEEQASVKRGADFWVVTGLCVYVVVNFFIFLFYTTLVFGNFKQFTIAIWNVHNISYIVLCLFLAKAFYDAA